MKKIVNRQTALCLKKIGLNLLTGSLFFLPSLVLAASVDDEPAKKFPRRVSVITDTDENTVEEITMPDSFTSIKLPDGSDITAFFKPKTGYKTTKDNQTMYTSGTYTLNGYKDFYGDLDRLFTDTNPAATNYSLIYTDAQNNPQPLDVQVVSRAANLQALMTKQWKKDPANFKTWLKYAQGLDDTEVLKLFPWLAAYQAKSEPTPTVTSAPIVTPIRTIIPIPTPTVTSIPTPISITGALDVNSGAITGYTDLETGGGFDIYAFFMPSPLQKQTYESVGDYYKRIEADITSNMSATWTLKNVSTGAILLSDKAQAEAFYHTAPLFADVRIVIPAQRYAFNTVGQYNLDVTVNYKNASATRTIPIYVKQYKQPEYIPSILPICNSTQKLDPLLNICVDATAR